MKEMKIGYVCEVLHFLLRKRYGAPLVKLPIDLVDKDNEASLDLLCALFKHCKCKEDEERRRGVLSIYLFHRQLLSLTALASWFECEA